MPFWDRWRKQRADNSTTTAPGNVAGRPTRRERRDYTRAWGVLPRRTPQGRDPLRTLREIRDYNPDAAMAAWNFLRLVGKGVALQVVAARRSGEGPASPNPRGQATMDAFLAERAGQPYGGGLNALANVLTLTLLTQGAVAGELDLAGDLKDVVDWCPVAPQLITFVDPEDKGRPAPGVAGRTGEVALLPPSQFRYVPLDPEVDDPYGRAPFWPALEVAFFQMEVLRDLRAVAHTAGYPHIDITILYDIVYNNAPAHLKQPGQEDALRQWMDGILSDVQRTYNGLEPNDVWVHFDLARPGYTGPGQAGTINLQTLIQALDQQVVASLKQLPILLGRNFGSTETHANRQWEIFVESINALRAVVKALVEFWANQTLRVWGLAAVGVVSFAPLRVSDRYQDAQAARLETETAVRQWLAGFISHDQAAQQAAGQDAVGEPLLPELVGLGPEADAGERAGPRLLPAAGRGGRRSELDEVQLTPQWMQSLYRLRAQETAALATVLDGQHAQNILDIPDQDWAAAVEAGEGAARTPVPPAPTGDDGGG